MTWINAKAVVALVANAVLSWIFASKEKPSGSVSEPEFASKSEDAIATMATERTFPYPAKITISLPDATQESGFRSVEIEVIMFPPTHGAL